MRWPAVWQRSLFFHPGCFCFSVFFVVRFRLPWLPVLLVLIPNNRLAPLTATAWQTRGRSSRKGHDYVFRVNVEAYAVGAAAAKSGSKLKSKALKFIVDAVLREKEKTTGRFTGHSQQAGS